MSLIAGSRARHWPKEVTDAYLCKLGQDDRKRAEAMGIKNVGAYGVLGPYDMMFIYEAPNEKAAAGLPLSFAPEGSGQTTTWTLIPMEEFVQLAARLRG